MNELPRYSIEIDEEGFPLFEGLRVQEESLLYELMHSLRRLEPNSPKSLLVMDCAGESCWVNAFDAPLVAQSVEQVTEASSLWLFPGGRSEIVPHSTLEIDTWNRIHSWVSGAEKIPAVLSRKAHNQLLFHIPEHWMTQMPAFRRPEAPVQKASYWTNKYEKGEDRFELGGPTPVLCAEGPALSWLPHAARILVPGAGRGHDAVWLQENIDGARVEALDFSKAAREGFQKSYPQFLDTIPYHCADIFSYSQQFSGIFDLVFEHTLLCAIDPHQRTEYLASVERLLKPQGLYGGVFYVHTAPGGPPFGLTQWELRESLKQRFAIQSWKICPHSVPSRKGQELWAVFQKY